MTRKRVLSDTEIKLIRAEYKPNKRGFGYESIAKRFKVGASTIRDCVQYVTQYGSRV